MAPSPLTLRNLTTIPLTLKHIERFEDPNTQQTKPSAFPFASRNTTSLAPASPRLGEHAQTFNRSDVDITLLPFESYSLEATKKDEQERDSAPGTQNTTFRLTFSTPTGERHRIDTSPTYTQKATQNLTPLTQTPSTTLSALYHPGHPTPHLTVHTNHTHSPKTWMSSLPSTLPLSALSIPGTHNSHTYYRALPSVRCQLHTIKTQLQNGIRFLDIRVQPSHATDASKKDLYLVHGAFPVSLTGSKYLAPVLSTCYDFLAENPSETILISLKREGTGTSTDELLSEILERHYIAPNAEKWYTEPRIPYLKDVRGKLVLIRRYNAHTPSPSPTTNLPPSATQTGLNATSWPHNIPHALLPNKLISLQDFCEIDTPSYISKKLLYSTQHLSLASRSVSFIPGHNTDTTNPIPPGPLHLNFLSGSNFWRRGCWPDAVAGVVNRGVEEWVCRVLGLEGEGENGSGSGNAEGQGKGDGDRDGEVRVSGESVIDQRTGDVKRKAHVGDGGTGVVIMDNVGEGGDWDLVRLIIGFNMGVLLSIGGGGEAGKESKLG